MFFDLYPMIHAHFQDAQRTRGGPLCAKLTFRFLLNNSIVGSKDPPKISATGVIPQDNESEDSAWEIRTIHSFAASLTFFLILVVLEN